MCPSITRTHPLLSPEELAQARKAVDFHPLELIPGFGNVARGPIRDLYNTLLWNTLLGLGFVAIIWMMSGRYPRFEVLWINVAMANFVGFTIHALFMIGGISGLDMKIYLRSRTLFGLYTSAIATAGVLLGFLVAGAALDLDYARMYATPRWMAGMAISSVMISLILMSIFLWRSRSADAEAALERERQRSERAGREAALANLRALQAQIEPHFLFNTLANVTSLIDPDPAKAKRMLDSFIRFLRASLAATRSESTTLGAEKEMMGAFLEVLSIRMGPRLAFKVEIDPELESFVLPPMLLQPIVENAIRHGLEPKVEGGEVRVGARREGDDVLITIADTGVGFASTTAGGFGLTNVRDRLRLLFGERAHLAIAGNVPAGTIVTLKVPA